VPMITVTAPTAGWSATGGDGSVSSTVAIRRHRPGA
jgi:hypothetical protein